MSPSELVISASAPGKLILFGEHAVVYGKLALATSLSDLRTFVTLRVEKTDSTGTITVHMPPVGINHLTFSGSKLASILRNNAAHDGLTREPKLHDAVVAELRTLASQALVDEGQDEHQKLQQITSIVACLYLYAYLSVDLENELDKRNASVDISTTFPIGAGLGSSAALSVCLSAVMLQLHGYVSINQQNAAQETIEVVSQTHDVSHHKVLVPRSDDPQLETINRWAFVLEQLIHGTPSGIDNTVGTFGGVLTLCREEGKVNIQRIANVPDILRILIVNTKVPRNTKQVVSGVRERRDKNQEHMDGIMDGVELCSRSCLALFDKYQSKEVNVEQFFTQLEGLVDKNQQLLNDMGVGHEKLDRVVQVAKEHGLHAKLTGAGAGGCAFVLLRDTTSQQVVDDIRSGMENTEGFQCFETRIASHGVVYHLHQ